MSANDIPLFWWRVETNAAGEVISCEQVDEENRRSSRVAYVRGRDRKEGVKLALEWHARHKRYQSVSAKRLAAKRREAGQCRRCDTPICDGSGYLCKDHLESHRESQRRHARGESKRREPADAVALKERHLADHRLRARLGEQLPELLAKYDELDGTPSVFRDWLERELDVREQSPVRLVRAVG